MGWVSIMCTHLHARARKVLKHAFISYEEGTKLLELQGQCELDHALIKTKVETKKILEKITPCRESEFQVENNLYAKFLCFRSFL